MVTLETIKHCFIERDIEPIELPCSQKYSIEPFTGLYFIGSMYIDPEDNHYYLVKIGKGGDVGQRINQYFGYNPLIYNEYNTIKTSGYSLEIAEENCHAYLSQWAIGIAAGTKEWYHVTKDIYFLLCDMFRDEVFFEMVANGEIGPVL